MAWCSAISLLLGLQGVAAGGWCGDPSIPRTDFVGADVGYKDDVPTPEQCCIACGSFTGCTTWTWNTSTKRCWFKSNISNRSNNNIAISGTACRSCNCTEWQATLVNAQMSSTLNNLTAASVCIDGYMGKPQLLCEGECCHTDEGTDIWLEVELATACEVSTVIVYNRNVGTTSNWNERLGRHQVFVGPNRNPLTLCSELTNTSRVVTHYCLGRPLAKFVRVVLPGPRRVINLAEVEVFCCTDCQRNKLSVVGARMQPVPSASYAADLCIDGITPPAVLPPICAAGSCCKADPTAAWIELELSEPSYVWELVIYNARVPDFLDHYSIEVGNTTTAMTICSQRNSSTPVVHQYCSAPANQQLSKFVRVNAVQNLTMYEVEVYQCDPICSSISAPSLDGYGGQCPQGYNCTNVTCLPQFYGTPYVTCVRGAFNFFGCYPVCPAQTTPPTGYVGSCDEVGSNCTPGVVCDTPLYQGNASVNCTNGTFIFQGCSALVCTASSPPAGYVGSCEAGTRCSSDVVCDTPSYQGTAVVNCSTNNSDFMFTGCTEIVCMAISAPPAGYIGQCEDGAVCSPGVVCDAPTYEGNALVNCTSGGFTFDGCVRVLKSAPAPATITVTPETTVTIDYSPALVTPAQIMAAGVVSAGGALTGSPSAIASFAMLRSWCLKATVDRAPVPTDSTILGLIFHTKELALFVDEMVVLGAVLAIISVIRGAIILSARVTNNTGLAGKIYSSCNVYAPHYELILGAIAIPFIVGTGFLVVSAPDPSDHVASVVLTSLFLVAATIVSVAAVVHLYRDLRTPVFVEYEVDPKHPRNRISHAQKIKGISIGNRILMLLRCLGLSRGSWRCHSPFTFGHRFGSMFFALTWTGRYFLTCEYVVLYLINVVLGSRWFGCEVIWGLVTLLWLILLIILVCTRQPFARTGDRTAYYFLLMGQLSGSAALCATVLGLAIPGIVPTVCFTLGTTIYFLIRLAGMLNAYLRESSGFESGMSFLRRSSDPFPKTNRTTIAEFEQDLTELLVPQTASGISTPLLTVREMSADFIFEGVLSAAPNLNVGIEPIAEFRRGSSRYSRNSSGSENTPKRSFKKYQLGASDC